MLKDQLVVKDHRDHRVILEHKELKDHKAILEHKELKEILVLREL